MGSATKYIGITGKTEVDPTDSHAKVSTFRTGFTRLVVESGALPVFIPNVLDAKVLDSYIDCLDGLILTGGQDISSEIYAYSLHQISGDNPNTDSNRDKVELSLFHKARNKGISIMGVCRGYQLINVGMGGTLIHDIEDSLSIPKQKHDVLDEDGGSLVLNHRVRVKPKTKLFKILKKRTFSVNSRHHQAIDKLGAHMRISAISDDGIPEAIEHTNGEFILGVQWHPEQLPEMETSKELFNAFVQAS